VTENAFLEHLGNLALLLLMFSPFVIIFAYCFL